MPSINLNKEIHYCVIIPTYNNQNTLRQVLKQVLDVTTDVIVVNDGSTDSSSTIIADFSTLQVVSYPKNRGKGNALKRGFRKAIELGYEYAITIDSDGQHYPDDIPKLIKEIEKEPGKLIMGSRNMKQAGVPGKSSFGNKFSNFWFWAETGITLSDTQTGFRAYPLEKIKKMFFFTQKFEFEIEVIVRLAWKNVKFAEVPVKVDYPEDRVSHFRPFKDFMRISVLNTFLFTLALLFFLPRLLIINFSLARLWRNLRQEFLKDLNHPNKISFAVSLGFFFGILPIWGFQMIAAFAVATYFKLNRVIVLIVSNISVAPMIPIIVFISFKLGAWFVDEPVTFVAISAIDSETIYLQLKQYIIGSSALAVGVAIIGFFVVRTVAFIISKGKSKL